jgi:type VI secretion system protein ImpA
MPLPEGLLNPIPGENPSGQSLRYDPVYDKIREARRADEDLQLSEEASKKDIWTSAIKKADFVLVAKLATEALSKKTKDLQIAAWLTEALLVQDRIPGLTQGLGLLRGLIENFWDTLYPEVEDGDLEMRSGPIEWVGARLDMQVRKVPLTKNKLDWLKFQESRRIGYEADAQGNEAKMTARQEAIAEKKCTAEEFDDAVRNTGESYYRQLTSDLAAAVEATQALEALTDEKFGRDAPNFANLKKALEDLQDAVREFWKPEEEKEPTPEPEAVAEEQGEAVSQTGTASAAAAVRKRVAVSEEPAGPEDALRRMHALARYLRLANPASPVPYMVLRGLRWGELRAGGSSLDPSLLESPPSETRQQLKKLAAEGQWNGVLETAEVAMGLPCGRGWLDLQRYTVRACESLGHEAVAASVCAGLRSLLSDYPDLASTSLSDDTPAANNETQAWITDRILPPPSPAPEPEIVMAPHPASTAAGAGNNGSAPPDVHELAQQAARSGRIQDAFEILSREIAQERSGRARFHRKIQLAALCLSAKHEAIAYPILEELSQEIDRRKLEEWEESSSLAHPLALLLRCMDKLGYDEAAKQKIYQKICRLDPVQALAGMR